MLIRHSWLTGFPDVKNLTTILASRAIASTMMMDRRLEGRRPCRPGRDRARPSIVATCGSRRQIFLMLRSILFNSARCFSSAAGEPQWATNSGLFPVNVMTVNLIDTSPAWFFACHEIL